MGNRERGQEGKLGKVAGANMEGHGGRMKEFGLCQSDMQKHWSVLSRQMT